MTTLRMETTVQDYDAWKTAFDKFDRARRDRGVRSYRVSRTQPGHDVTKVLVDLQFDSTTRAEEFAEFLAGVFRTPQSQGVSVDHAAPLILDVVEDVVLA